ncbi:MAG TPA: YceI family protein [Saprospiraceae bacterium]|nr:YceI family protein [Saprospiraceae bacterium]
MIRLFFWLSCFLLLNNSYLPTADKTRFHIQEGSRLYLKGTSNVNSFSCDCQDRFEGQLAELDRKGGYTKFKNAELRIRSGNFDCKNRKIDQDMQKALKAEQFPFIKISLIDSWQNPKCLDGSCKDWFDVQANVNITITNVTKTFTVPAKAKIIGSDRFLLKGESALQMSSFGITPPEAMFGMIKVNDWISFHFDLNVWVDPGQ